MTHFGQSSGMAAGHAGALDADYEASCGAARWEKQYYWPDRCWRWVKTMRLEWGRCAHPAQPDEAMQPERLSRKGVAAPGCGRGGYRPEAAAAMRAARLATGQATDAALCAALRAFGPCTQAELSEATGLHRTYVGERLRRRPDLYRRVGVEGRAAVWDVAQP